jgi:hypothetical protein
MFAAFAHSNEEISVWAQHSQEECTDSDENNTSSSVIRRKRSEGSTKADGSGE